MAPNDKPERPLPLVGSITTYTYSGPVAWPRKPYSTQTPIEGDDNAREGLQLLGAATHIVTYIIDGKTGRIRRKEE